MGELTDTEWEDLRVAYRGPWGDEMVAAPPQRLVTAVERIVAAHVARATADAWPCDNYKAPVTCLTAPCAEGSECDHCREQKARAAADAEARLAAARVDVWDEAMRWIRHYAEITTPEHAIEHIDRAEPFNPYRAALDPAPTTDADAHTCTPPRRAEDFDQWRCPTCGSWWTANEDDGWTRETAPTTDADGRDERRDGAGGTRWERG